MPGIFRKTALSRLESPEQTDQISHVTSLRGWLALLGIGVSLVVLIFWGFYGSIPTKVSGSGMLMRSGGVFSILAPGEGQLREVHVLPNDDVFAGQVVGRITRTDVMRQLDAGLTQVDEIRAKIKAMEEGNVAQNALTDKTADQQRLNLLSFNRMLDTENKRLEERLAGEVKLASEGLITSQQVLQTRQQIHQIKMNQAKNFEGIANLVVSKAGTGAQQQAKLADLKVQLQNAQANVVAIREILEETTRVISPYSGRVVEVQAAENDIVGVGTPIALVELTGDDIKNLAGVFFFSPDVGKFLKPGMDADLSPSVAKPEQYGYLRAIVTSVSQYPVSSQNINEIFHNAELTQQMMKNGAPIEVQADLIPSPSTISGYRWTSSGGPPIRLNSGTITGIQVTVKKQPPVTLILPFLKSFFLGTGE